ncbi:hypothetical protein DFH01_03475 [Falsiroseomonas bella]|uniref:N-acetyltransferase n=1 Tax=Falsiroseomonas bella TaxID=2184016 RepID=A0A317FH17_9PROT|nr:hypothetical protein [Falsiroseomonas bella]PWS38361.1 hypothetical protein DFH01_03475 [Falsiroseomonas bella]
MRAFIELPARLGPLGWSVPLRWEERRLFDAGKNGFLRDHAVARFLAWRDGRAVGRIAACVPLAGPGPASFGFLRAEQDAAAVSALLDAARGFAALHGRATLDGPLSFTINHEVGALIEPADRAPMLRMPRTPPWLPDMIAQAGFTPLGDVLACTLDLASERHRARFVALAARRQAEMARLRLRGFDRRDFDAEVARVADLYDDAWAENRHAVPLRPGEIATMSKLLRPLLMSGEVVFAEWDGAPVGLVSIVPNIEPALPRDGRLLPFGWIALAKALAGRVGSARIPMLGIARAFRGHPASALAMGALLDAAIGVAARRGWRQVEISWILEENTAMRNAMARLGAPVSGRWRLWRGGTERMS